MACPWSRAIRWQKYHDLWFQRRRRGRPGARLMALRSTSTSARPACARSASCASPQTNRPSLRRPAITLRARLPRACLLRTGRRQLHSWRAAMAAEHRRCDRDRTRRGRAPGRTRPPHNRRGLGRVNPARDHRLRSAGRIARLEITPSAAPLLSGTPPAAHSAGPYHRPSGLPGVTTWPRSNANLTNLGTAQWRQRSRTSRCC